MEIKQAESSNLGEIRELLRLCQLPDADISVEQLEHYYLAYTKDQQMVGVVGIEPLDNCGLLRSLAVNPEYRNQGFGYLLLKTAEHAARAKHIHSLYLLTETAKDYLLRFGYEAVARDSVPADVAATSEFSRLCPATAHCLRLRVPAEK